MNKRMINKLNKTPLSDLILMAVEDMRAVQRAGKAKGVILNMLDWVRPATHSSDNLCQVCMAGAVMFRHCGVQDSDLMVIPAFADALNEIRVGHTYLALQALKQCVPGDVCERVGAVIGDEQRIKGRYKFSTYKKIAAVLKEYGL